MQNFSDPRPVDGTLSRQFMFIRNPVVVVQMAVHHPGGEFFYQVFLPFHGDPQVVPDRRDSGPAGKLRSLFGQDAVSGIIA